MKYAEKLKDPRWQKKRLKILERDGFACQCCKAKDKTLHVHHLEYSKTPWDISDYLLVTLCEDCHKSIEELKEEKIRIPAGLFSKDWQYTFIKLGFIIIPHPEFKSGHIAWGLMTWLLAHAKATREEHEIVRNILFKEIKKSS